jgi:hypothetical protein
MESIFGKMLRKMEMLRIFLANVLYKNNNKNNFTVNIFSKKMKMLRNFEIKKNVF